MAGAPLKALESGLADLRTELLGDSLAIKRVEVALVGFPPVRTLIDFSAVDTFKPPKLKAEGGTPLGEAVQHALRMSELRKQQYRDHGIEYFRPWIFLITDGAPTDPAEKWQAAAAEMRAAEARSEVTFFAVGVPGADMRVLSAFSKRSPAPLIDLRFREMFVWLTSSLRAVAGSSSHTGADPRAKVPLDRPDDWTEV